MSKRRNIAIRFPLIVQPEVRQSIEHLLDFGYGQFDSFAEIPEELFSDFVLVDEWLGEVRIREVHVGRDGIVAIAFGVLTAFFLPEIIQLGALLFRSW